MLDDFLKEKKENVLWTILGSYWGVQCVVFFSLQYQGVLQRDWLPYHLKTLEQNIMTEVVCYLKSHFSMVFLFFFPHRRKEGHSEENTNKSEKSSRKTNAKY